MDAIEKFKIVFEKLEEAVHQDGLGDLVISVSPEELDEIEELRRFAAELSQPEPASFTTT